MRARYRKFLNTTVETELILISSYFSKSKTLVTCIFFSHSIAGRQRKRALSNLNLNIKIVNHKPEDMPAENSKPNIGVYTNPAHNLWIGSAEPAWENVESGEGLKEGEVTIAIKSTGICGYVFQNFIRNNCE